MVTCPAVSISDEEDITISPTTKSSKEKIWRYPYIERNAKSSLFIIAEQLTQTDTKLIALYRMSKDSNLHLIQIDGCFFHSEDRYKYERVRDCGRANLNNSEISRL